LPSEEEEEEEGEGGREERGRKQRAQQSHQPYERCWKLCARKDEREMAEKLNSR
jgi:hypothetical protein